jgi:hypothetical protein
METVERIMSGIDLLKVLDQNLAIVRGWKPLSEERRKHLLERVASLAGDGHLEDYKYPL